MSDTSVKKENKTTANKKIDASSVIDKVDLTIEAYLGEASISIAELKNLSSDQVVELSSSLNQSVELRLNGVTIAVGELVAVENKFGVKITNLAE